MDDKVMNLLGKVKGTARSAAAAAGSTARFAGKKAESMLDSTRLNVRIYELNSDVAVLLRDAGKIVYDAHLGMETNDELLGKILEQLDSKNAQIMELRARIDDLKSVSECPSCGSPCSKGDRFCKACGCALN